MPTTNPTHLGQLIFDENPYSLPPVPPAPKTLNLMIEQTEVSYRPEMEWYFKNTENYVKKALRIPYCYKDKDGHDIVDYLLIGFEGGGGE